VRDDAPDVARLLIARGGDITAKDWQGRTPLDLAGTGNNTADAIRAEISLRHAQHAKAVLFAQAGKSGDAK